MDLEAISAKDLDAMLRRMGSTVTTDTGTAYALLDRVGVEELDGIETFDRAERISLTYRTGGLASMTVGAVLTYQSDYFRVYSFERMQDGGITIAYLERWHAPNAPARVFGDIVEPL